MDLLIWGLNYLNYINFKHTILIIFIKLFLILSFGEKCTSSKSSLTTSTFQIDIIILCFLPLG